MIAVYVKKNLHQINLFYINEYYDIYEYHILSAKHTLKFWPIPLQK